MDQYIVCDRDILTQRSLYRSFLYDNIILYVHYKNILKTDYIRSQLYDINVKDAHIIKVYFSVLESYNNSIKNITNIELYGYIETGRQRNTIRSRAGYSDSTHSKIYEDNLKYIKKLSNHVEYLRTGYFNPNADDNDVIEINVSAYYGGYEMKLSFNKALLIENSLILQLYIYLYFISIGFSICSYAIFDSNHKPSHNFNELSHNMKIIVTGSPTINLLVLRPKIYFPNNIDTIKNYVNTTYSMQDDLLIAKITEFHVLWCALKLMCLYYDFVYDKPTIYPNTEFNTDMAHKYIDDTAPFKRMQLIPKIEVNDIATKLSNPSKYRKHITIYLSDFLVCAVELYNLYYKQVAPLLPSTFSRNIELIITGSNVYTTLNIPRDPVLGKLMTDLYCILIGTIPEYYNKTYSISNFSEDNISRFYSDTKIFAHGYNIKGTIFYDISRKYFTKRVNVNNIVAVYENFDRTILPTLLPYHNVDTNISVNLEGTEISLDSDFDYGSMPLDDVTNILLESIEYQPDTYIDINPSKRQKTSSNLGTVSEYETDLERFLLGQEQEPPDNENIIDINSIENILYGEEEGGPTPKFNITDYDKIFDSVYQIYKIILEREDNNIQFFINYVTMVNNSVLDANEQLMKINSGDDLNMVSIFKSTSSDTVTEALSGLDKSIGSAYRSQLYAISSTANTIKTKTITPIKPDFIKRVSVYINGQFKITFDDILIMDVNTFKIEMKFRVIAHENRNLNIGNMYLMIGPDKRQTELRYDLLYNESPINLNIILK